jgi:hypothetical protein
MFSGDGERVRVVRKPVLKEVDNVYEIVAESSHLAWMDRLPARQGTYWTRSASLWETSPSPGLCVSRADGFLHEFQEYALKDYCSTGCIDLAATGDSRLMILDICT